MLADVFDGNTPPVKLPKTQAIPKEPGLEDLFPRTEINFPPLNEYSLQGVHIPGLNDSAIHALGVNHFVVAETRLSNNSPMSTATID